MSNNQTTTAVCPCGTVLFPQVTCNLPDLPAIAYRIGDFNAFRYQLLQSLPGETELTAWRPGAEGDLAVQMMEWWAYVGDILTFYNERIANESYLHTALLPESVNHLVQQLGYRPKPALGAHATLAALLTPTARLPLKLPAGLQIQSKPGPGKSPQIFEVDSPTTIGAPDIVTADVVPSRQPLLDTARSTLWLAGKISGLKPGDRFLLINAAATTAQTIKDYAWINLTGTAAGSDPLGNPVTQVAFSSISGSIADGAQAKNYVLLRSQQASPLWGYSTTVPAITATKMDLASVARNVTAGCLLLVDVADCAAATLAAALRAEADVEVGRGDAQLAATLRAEAIAAVADLVPTPIIAQSYSEVVWYANGDGPNLPNPSGTTVAVPAIAIPHAEIGFVSGSLPGTLWSDIIPQINVRWGFSPVGQLVPVGQSSDFIYPTGGSTLDVAPAGANALPTTFTPVSVLLEDPDGNAAATTLTNAGTPPVVNLGALTPNPTNGLASPIDIFFNLLGCLPRQDRGVRDTRQRQSLGCRPGLHACEVARHLFLRSGIGLRQQFQQHRQSERQRRAVAGSAELLRPTAECAGVRAARRRRTDPRDIRRRRQRRVAADGTQQCRRHLPLRRRRRRARRRDPDRGADADRRASRACAIRLRPPAAATPTRPSQLRTLAPQSVMTFNRAVSLDDYAAIARTASGVTQAVASFAFDPLAQRPMVTLWIAGDAGAVGRGRRSHCRYRGAGPGPARPSRPRSTATLSLTYRARSAICEPPYRRADNGAASIRMSACSAATSSASGRAIYRSQIAAACLAVPGVTAIQNFTLATSGGTAITPLSFNILGASIAPVTPSNCSGQSYSPGAGKYFFRAQ